MIIVRRTVVICGSLAALPVPAAALAVSENVGDGTLVVKNGSAPRGVPVVTLVIRGAVIGEVTGVGKIVIDDPTPRDGFAPEVTGVQTGIESRPATPPTKWGGADFRFRAVGGTYKITIYGSDVDLVASGHGTVILAGSTDTPTQDGRYSLNGGDFRSLPATPTKLLSIGAPTARPGKAPEWPRSRKRCSSSRTKRRSRRSSRPI